MATLKITQEIDEYDSLTGLIIELDKLRLRFHDGEPEDNTLARNFNDCYLIYKLIEYAHLAGSQGIPLETIEETVKEDD